MKSVGMFNNYYYPIEIYYYTAIDTWLLDWTHNLLFMKKRFITLDQIIVNCLIKTLNK